MKTRVPKASDTDPLAAIPLQALTREVGYLVVSYLRVQSASPALVSIDRRLAGARQALSAARDPSSAGALTVSEASDAEAAVLRAHDAWQHFVGEWRVAHASLAHLVRRVARSETARRRGARSQQRQPATLQRAAVPE